MRIAVIIPTRDKSKYLNLTLAALENQTYRDFEVYINDGGSDDTDQVVHQYSKTLNIKYRKGPCGRSSARNQILRECQTDYIISIDDDRIPDPHFVEAHVRTLEAHPQTVSVGAKHVILSFYSPELDLHHTRLIDLMRRNNSVVNLLINNDHPQLISKSDVTTDFQDAINRTYSHEPLDNNRPVLEAYGDSLEGFHFGWALAHTGNMAFDRSYARDVFFDEGFQGWGVEDAEFSYQLFCRGYKFRFTQDAVNYHQEHVREPHENESFKINLKYFCKKYQSVDVYMFARLFLGDFSSFVEVNQIYDQYTKSVSERFRKDYEYLCKLRVEI